MNNNRSVDLKYGGKPKIKKSKSLYLFI